jgi:hypothetical protein
MGIGWDSGELIIVSGIASETCLFKPLQPESRFPRTDFFIKRIILVFNLTFGHHVHLFKTQLSCFPRRWNIHKPHNPVIQI